MNDESLIVPAYAKVNFTLDILSLRQDGYHGVATVMQTISQADRVILNRRDREEITLECDDPSIPRDQENLAVRAAMALRDSVARPFGVHIQLQKGIPSQAGLGGGSSDAAAVIRGLNHLLKLRLGAAALSAIGSRVGSDVPFFCHGGTAACRGRGEVVCPLTDAPGLWFVITKPELKVSTADAYRALDSIQERASARATRNMEEILATGDKDRIISRMTNDFEQVLFTEYLALAALHDDLMMARSLNARLCGSGSALFGVTLSRPSAEEVARSMRMKYRQVTVCRSVTRAESMAFGEPVD